MGSIKEEVAKGLARRAAAELESLGATRPEINLLLGIGAAESNFGMDDHGPGGERGFWQLETEPRDISEQATKALRQLREIYDTLSLYSQQPWYRVIVDDWRQRGELIRVAWQMGKTGPAKAIKYWLEGRDRNDPYSVKRRWETTDTRDKLPSEKDEDAKVRKLTAGGKLGAVDFITYCEKQLGADGEALRRGLRTYRDRMQLMNYDALAFVGYSGIAQEAKSDEAPALSSGDYGWLGNRVRDLFAGLKGGLKVLLGEFTTSVLPPMLLVLGAGAALAYIKRLWTVGSRLAK